MRFLIVHADEALSRDLGERLAALGYGVAGRVPSGREALEGFAGFAPDAVIVDTHLAGDPDAVRLAGLLRGLRTVPVLFVKPLEEGKPSAREILGSPAGILRTPLCDREIRAVLEVALEETRAFLVEVVENSGAQVFVKDEEGRYLYVNRKWEEVSGLGPAETLGRRDEDLFPPGSCAQFRVHDLQAMAEGRVLEFEETLLTPTGPRYFLSLKFPHRDGAGQVAGVCGLATEITDLKRVELELRYALEQAQLFRSILDASPVAVFIKDLERRYLYGNQRFLDEMGLSTEELLGMSDLELHGPAADEAVRATDERALAGERTDSEVELSLPRRGTRVLWVVKSPLVSEGSGEKPWGLLGIASDITDRRSAQEERARLQEQLQQAVKMESIGRLAGGVAHDFNNMLSVILGQAELALSALPPDHPQAAPLQEIRSAARRSADLTRQLLAFARRQTVVPKVLDLNDTVEGMLGILGRLLGEDLELVWIPGAALWPVRLDPSQVDQILANLCVNARDAIRGRGTVTLQTANVPEGLGSDAVLLQVGDDGCGMDPETQAHIFEPFFTTKGRLEGTGLGLSTVYGIVRQNGGAISVESEPGRGTTFRLLLPRHCGPVEEEPAEPPPRRVPESHGTVLLVEDEPALLRMTQTMLEQLGYSVLPSAHPLEAAQLAREHAGDIDLLLTDIVMPEMNGLELAERVRDSRPRAPHVFMSGYTEDVIANRGGLDGARFLPKPFSLQELGDALRLALG